MPTWLSGAWVWSVSVNSRPSMPSTVTFAGALYTPRSVSVRAHVPATCPLGGMYRAVEFLYTLGASSQG